VRLADENRREKLRAARLDLNDRIADPIGQADLDSDNEALLENCLEQTTKRSPPAGRLVSLVAQYAYVFSSRY